MTDYVAQLSSPQDWLRRDAERAAERVRTGSTITDGVIRWNSNQSVPPVECVALAVHIGLPVDVAKSTLARDAETTAFLKAYRKRRRDPSGEELFELRAAHGPGVTVVNALTGRKTRT